MKLLAPTMGMLMRHESTIGPARPREQAAALELAFRHLAPAERDNRIANALRLLHRGDVSPEGLLVARAKEGLLGAMICAPVPGASGVVWPPQTVAEDRRKDIEDRLLDHAKAWLQQQGAKLAQALLLNPEAGLGEALERNGFAHTTSLWYMRCLLDGPDRLLARPDYLTYRSYSQSHIAARFHETLLRTYEEALDCPEVNGVRSLDEILAGHRAQGIHDPSRWWLALDADRPVGVLLLTESSEGDGWDVSYVGVVREARGHGHGRALMQLALRMARQGRAGQLTLSVDSRNRPAWNLYNSLGFESYEEREVYLAIWKRMGSDS